PEGLQLRFRWNRRQGGEELARARPEEPHVTRPGRSSLRLFPEERPGSIGRNQATMSNPIRPPFTLETALAKVQAAEDAWNSRDPNRISMSYTENSEWRNRTEFFKGRD